MNNPMTFTVTNDEGKEMQCEMLFSFESKETGNNYIVYTDNSVDEDGETRVFASIYMPEIDGTRLFPIETDREWALVEKILEKLQNAAASEI